MPEERLKALVATKDAWIFIQLPAWFARKTGMSWGFAGRKKYLHMGPMCLFSIPKKRNRRLWEKKWQRSFRTGESMYCSTTVRRGRVSSSRTANFLESQRLL